MAIVFLNNFSTVTASPLAPADTTLELQDGIADIAAALTGGNTLVLTLFVSDDQGNETQREIIHATAADELAGTLTIERAKEGTTAEAWEPNAGIEQRLTAGSLSESFRGLISNDTDESTSIIIGGGDGERGRSNCIVIGPGAYASRDGCLAVGVDAKAEDSDTIAVGNNAVADRDYSMAIGHGATAGDDNTVAVGRNAKASSDSTVVVGNGAEAGDRDTVVIGFAAKAVDDSSVVIGKSAKGESGDVIAIGESSKSSGKDAIAIGQDSLAAGKGSIAIGERTEARVPGGMQFGAVSYLARGDGSQTVGMPSVIASGEMDMSDGSAARSIQAPEGMLLMPDSIEFFLSGVNSAYTEKAINPEGLTASNAGGFMRKSPDGSLLLYSDGADAYLLNLPDLTLVAGAPTDLADVEDAAFDSGNYLVVARASGPHPSLSVYNVADWTNVSSFTSVSGPAYRVAFNAGSKIVAIQESAGQYELVVVDAYEWSTKKTGVTFAAIPNAIDFDFKTFGVLVVTDSQISMYKEDFISSEWAEDPYFSALTGGSDFYMSPDGGRAFVLGSGGTGKIAVYETDGYSSVGSFPSPASSSGKTTSLGFSSDGKSIFVGIDEAPGISVVRMDDLSESEGKFSLSTGVTSISVDSETGEVYALAKASGGQPLSVLVQEDDSASLKVGSAADGNDYAAATPITTEGGVGTRAIPSAAVPPAGVKVLHGSVDTPSQFPSTARFVVRGYFVEV